MHPCAAQSRWGQQCRCSEDWVHLSQSLTRLQLLRVPAGPCVVTTQITLGIFTPAPLCPKPHCCHCGLRWHKPETLSARLQTRPSVTSRPTLLPSVSNRSPSPHPHLPPAGPSSSLRGLVFQCLHCLCLPCTLCPTQRDLSEPQTRSCYCCAWCPVLAS